MYCASPRGGGRDTSVLTRMPAAYPFAVNSAKLTWQYEAGPEPYLNDRMIAHPRGRVLGGSSSVNAMAFVRGHPTDYDGWAQRGLTSWTWERCLPYFKKIERYDGGANIWRGGDGPIRVQTSRTDEKLFDCFLTAGEQAGFGTSDDYNGYRQEGVHRSQSNSGGGVRWSTARAYLHPALSRDNLTVMTGALVQNIRIDGNRAVGLTFSYRGKEIRVEATQEVVLSAGAIATPQLMLLSGVGDAHHLREMEIPVVRHLPGVGANLEDHVAVPVRYHTSGPISFARHLGPIGRARIGLDWALRRKGLGTTNYFEVGGFIRSHPDVEIPDVQLELLPMLRVYRRGKIDVAHGFQLHVNTMRPTSRGRVQLKSRNPSQYPSILFNYLKDKEDIDTLVRAIKAARELVAQRAWDGVRGAEIEPGKDVQTERELLSWLRANAATEYHPACTCRMGTDSLAVVDEWGLVHGLENLRIVDASIIPRMITGNLNAPVMMMAEKIADHMRGLRALDLDRGPLLQTRLTRLARPLAEKMEPTLAARGQDRATDVG
ncbi:choline dehydrogenase (plasmid) [Mesorhizobium sp. ORM8.1]